jgi:hypothetical protein
MDNLPFGIALIVLAVLSVIIPYFFDDDKNKNKNKNKGISIEIDENGNLLF